LENARYKVIYSDLSEEQLKNIDASVRKQIRNAIEKKLMIEPVKVGKPLRRSLKGYKRLRVGSYRVIYEVNEHEVFVLIIEIGHRKDIYEK
jgi:mRNA interferase RelE/StbE